MTAAQYRLQPGYGFVCRLSSEQRALLSTGVPFGLLSSPDDWDTEVLGDDDCASAELLGTRRIDGATCAVFLARDPEAESGWALLAQTTAHAQVSP